VKAERKVVPYEDVASWRSGLDYDDKLVLTNGCFDVFHAGHVLFLEEARDLGHALIVGVNADWAVARLKGPTRPINTEMNRALIVAALACVSLVTIFPSTDITALLRVARPHIWVKGGDYTVESLDQAEVAVARQEGVEIKILPLTSGLSTSGLIAKIKHGTL
jgi:rfaE bifunctional protein nucleotidyltransferase chain/domain